MKIFSQSTACAFVAVANGLSFSPDADPDLVWKATQEWEKMNEEMERQQMLACARIPAPIWCPPANPAPLYQEFQLYGGWDLPVPEPSADEFIRQPGQPYIADQRECYMSHLPSRGQTGEMKRVHCWSNEINAFKNGNGPTWFTGFFLSSGWPREHCSLVKDGKFITLMNGCRSAMRNTDTNRFIQEDKSGGGWGETPIPGDKYFY